MYPYIKALHIVFVVTWFAGLFYVVRLFIYNREAQDKTGEERNILQSQFQMMIKRLWFGITWPSCILTFIFGAWMMYLLPSLPAWLIVKLLFVFGLFAYHLSLHALYQQQSKSIFRFSSKQLRLWNEVATVFLFAIVFLATVKNTLSFVWGLVGLIALVILLMAGMKVYAYLRRK
jgi:protoporphyrinogen IX oxidase